jgi:RNA polymerase sigma-70 factor (ECF subfamily)
MMAWPSALLPRSVMRDASEEPSENSENELARRLANGDHDAVVAAYGAHHAEVRAFARRLVGDVGIAEDLVHEVFVALPASMRRFRGECSLRSWLVAIAARHARSHVRAAQRRRAAEARLAHEPRSEVETPDAQLHRAELARILTQALDELPLDQRIAFVLCEVEERSSVEAGEILGAQDGTIRARVFHAKKKLRELLARGERAEGGAR